MHKVKSSERQKLKDLYWNAIKEKQEGYVFPPSSEREISESHYFFIKKGKEILGAIAIIPNYLQKFGLDFGDNNQQILK